MANDFAGAFAALRQILKKHSAGLVVHNDSLTDYTLITPSIGMNGKPIWFGAVMAKKSAVTFHLFPLYFNPKLQSAVPKELLLRKQGKTCFNFRVPDKELFAMLDELTRISKAHFEAVGFLTPGPLSPETLAAALKAGGTDSEQLAKIRKAKGAAAAKKRAATIARKQAATR